MEEKRVWDKVEAEMHSEKERRWKRFVEEDRQFSTDSTDMLTDFLNRWGRRRRND